jgi:hypothetical protein
VSFHADDVHLFEQGAKILYLIEIIAKT